MNYNDQIRPKLKCKMPTIIKENKQSFYRCYLSLIGLVGRIERTNNNQTVPNNNYTIDSWVLYFPVCLTGL